MNTINATMDILETSVHAKPVLRAAADLDQGQGAVYVNFADNERLRDAYPKATLERLAAIKAEYDPTNLFHLNYNIAPKSSK